MYIEQAYEQKKNGLFYLVFLGGFFGFMALNFLLSNGVDVSKEMQILIKEFGRNTTFVLLVAPLSFGCLTLLFWVKFVHRQSITSLTTSRKTIDWSRVLFSFLLWTTCTILFFVISYFTSPEHYQLAFNLERFIPFAIAAILLVPLQTSFEEYLFRGYIMQGLGIFTKNRAVPLIFTSIVFGLLHISNPEVGEMGPIILIYYIGTGFFLGILTLMDDGMELALGFHAANNLIGALLVTSDWSVFQTYSIFKDISKPEAGVEIIIPIFVVFPMLLFLFGKKYHWSNWKEKLFGKLNIEFIEN